MIEPIHVLSLGAGVQSSTLALMAAAGEVTPMPRCAIFADTQAEPRSVYDWLDWIEKKLPFPIVRVSRGDLFETATTVVKSKNERNYTNSAVPAFIVDDSGQEGLLMRQCTRDFKIKVIEQAIRRVASEEIKAWRKNRASVPVVQWIGISSDESLRAKPSRLPYVRNIWPLIERRMRRQNCLEWMQSRGFPRPPRSACVFCPYRSDEEWQRLKTEEPPSFERAVDFEKKYQSAMAQVHNFRGVPWLHRSFRPLEEIDFSKPLDDGREPELDFFGTDCEGMCGV